MFRQRILFTVSCVVRDTWHVTSAHVCVNIVPDYYFFIMLTKYCFTTGGVCLHTDRDGRSLPGPREEIIVT